MSHDLFAHMASLAREMGEAYARIQTRVKEDPGTAGDQGEENWAAVLRGWLPTRFRVVTKGRLLGVDGSASPQVDVLVLSAAYPAALESEKLYLADGVVAAFECKITLRSSHIRAAFDTAARIRALTEAGTGTPYRELVGKPLYGVLAHSSEWSGDVIAARREIQTRLEAGLQSVEHPRTMLDILCVADVDSWTSQRSVWIGPGSPCLGQMRVLRDGEWKSLAGVNESTWATLMPDWPTTGSVTSQFSALRRTTEAMAGVSAFGPFLAALLAKLAWESPDLRPIANYFIRAGLLGEQIGNARTWPFDVYSDVCRKSVRGSRLLNDQPWNPWGCSLL